MPQEPAFVTVDQDRTGGQVINSNYLCAWFPVSKPLTRHRLLGVSFPQLENKSLRTLPCTCRKTPILKYQSIKILTKVRWQTTSGLSKLVIKNPKQSQLWRFQGTSKVHILTNTFISWRHVSNFYFGKANILNSKSQSFKNLYVISGIPRVR